MVDATDRVWTMACIIEFQITKTSGSGEYHIGRLRLHQSEWLDGTGDPLVRLFLAVGNVDTRMSLMVSRSEGGRRECDGTAFKAMSEMIPGVTLHLEGLSGFDRLAEPSFGQLVGFPSTVHLCVVYVRASLWVCNPDS